MKTTFSMRTLAAIAALIIASSALAAATGTAPGVAGELVAGPTGAASADTSSTTSTIATRTGWGSTTWVQAAVLLGSGFNAGIGFRPWERFSLSINLDILEDQGSATASAIMYIPGDVPILTSAYVGAGATWELDSRAVHPSLTAGAELRLLFAEYEWVMAPDSYGKIRSGLRIRF